MIAGGCWCFRLEPGLTSEHDQTPCGSLLYVGLHHAQQFVALGAVADERASWIPLDCCGNAVATVATCPRALWAPVLTPQAITHQITSCFHVCVGRGPGAQGCCLQCVRVPKMSNVVCAWHRVQTGVSHLTDMVYGQICNSISKNLVYSTYIALCGL